MRHKDLKDLMDLEPSQAERFCVLSARLLLRMAAGLTLNERRVLWGERGGKHPE